MKDLTETSKLQINLSNSILVRLAVLREIVFDFCTDHSEIVLDDIDEFCDCVAEYVDEKMMTE